MIPIADMDHLLHGHPHLAGSRFEHGAMGFGMAHLVGKGKAVEMPGQVVAGEQAAQGAARGDNGVGDDAGPIAAVNLGQRLGYSGN